MDTMPDGQRILQRRATTLPPKFSRTARSAYQAARGKVTALVALPDNQHAISGSF